MPADAAPPAGPPSGVLLKVLRDIEATTTDAATRQRCVDARLAAGDSGGPREALREKAAALVAKLDAMKPVFDGMAVMAHVHGGYNGPNFGEELAALRAELGRAGTEPSKDDIRPVFREGFEAAFYESPTEPHQPHIDRAEEIAWLHSKARAHAAAPDAERPSEIERVMRLIADDYTAYNIGYVQQYREMARAAIAADAERREPAP